MGINTSIEWTDHSFNAWWGCTKVGPPCDHCYAEAWAKRTGFPSLWGVEADRRTFSDKHWNDPLKWDRDAAAGGKRMRVFTNSMADVFDNHPAVDVERWRLWDLIDMTPNLDWLLLTKRIGNAIDMLPKRWIDARDGLPRNVWLGATIADQKEATRDIPKLLSISAAVHFLSCEPLLGPIDLRYLSYDSGDRLPEQMRVNSGRCSLDALRGVTTWPGSHYQSPTIKRNVRFIDGEVFQSAGESRHIDWVICGGESGSGARPIHPVWVQSLRDQCIGAGTAFHFKQWGEWAPHSPQAGGDLGGDVRRGRVRIVHPSGRSDVEIFEATGGHNSERGSRYMAHIGKKQAGRLLDGRTWDEVPHVPG